MNDQLELPEVHTAVIDAATLARLFEELALADVLEIMLKAGASARASSGGVTLEQARHKLERREVAGVQIRYRHGGREWLDTLLHTPEGLKIVRMAAAAQ